MTFLSGTTGRYIANDPITRPDAPDETLALLVATNAVVASWRGWPAARRSPVSAHDSYLNVAGNNRQSVLCRRRASR